MTDRRSAALVSTDWLASHLGDPKVRIVDATWYMPNVPPAPDASTTAQ